METLGLTPSRKADSIWRNLFWPAIRTEVDVDQIGRQGFWLCFITAMFTLAVSLLAGVYIWALADVVSVSPSNSHVCLFRPDVLFFRIA